LRGLALLTVPLLVLSTTGGQVPVVPQEGPIVLVYSGSMPGWGAALCEILDGDSRAGYRCVNVEDRELLSILLFLPRTQGIVLAPVAAIDVKGMSPMLEDFMAQGGVVIGFSPCTDIRKEPVMGSEIFPFFANQTMAPEKVGGSPVNTYAVREIDPLINEGLPDTFQLISEGLLVAAGPGGEVLDLLPDDGQRTVFYQEKLTEAPLVIGYQRAGTGRSIGFSGCRVNSIPRSSSFYGNLAAQGEFVQLFRNAVLWATEGSQRYLDLGDTWSGTLAAELARRDEARLKAERMARKSGVGRAVLLASIWTGALLACVIVTRTLVLRQS
jgi:hypothetical protein